MRVRRILLLLGAALVACLGGSAALAQVDIAAIDPPSRGKPATTVHFDYHHAFETDIVNAGDIERDTFLARVSHRFDTSNDDVKLTPQFTYVGSYYDINASGDAYHWDNIHEITLALIASWKIADHWTLLGAGLVKSSGEAGADLLDTVTAGGSVGFTYSPSPDLQVGLLAGALRSLEDGVHVVPLPILDWKFAEDWRLHIGTVTVDTVGYGAEIGWAFSKHWELTTGASVERRRFRLDSGGANEDGIAVENSMPVFAKFSFHPNPGVDINFIGSLALQGELEIEDENGDKINDRTYDPAPGFAIQAHFRF